MQKSLWFIEIVLTNKSNLINRIGLGPYGVGLILDTSLLGKNATLPNLGVSGIQYPFNCIEISN